MNDGLDAVDHPAADHRPRQGIGCLHGAVRKARQRSGGVVRVDGGEAAAVAGVERLKQVGGLGPTDLADDDVVRPVAQRVPPGRGSSRRSRRAPPAPRTAGSWRGAAGAPACPP